MEFDTTKQGSVWLGPWHKDLIEGKFGSAEKQHYAMNNGCHRTSEQLVFFPFTSKKNNKPLMILAPGTAGFGKKAKTSYLLNIRLIVSRTNLYRHFEYQCDISKEKINEFVNNYKIALRKRKKGKKNEQ